MNSEIPTGLTKQQIENQKTLEIQAEVESKQILTEAHSDFEAGANIYEYKTGKNAGNHIIGHGEKYCILLKELIEKTDEMLTVELKPIIEMAHVGQGKQENFAEGYDLIIRKKT